jgi:prolyl 4-hydroxylase
MIKTGESVTERLMAQEGIQRLPSPKAELFQLRGFVPPDLCNELISLIDHGRRPSTIADFNGDAYFRTSETCDLAADLPAVQRFEALLTGLCGLDPAYGELLQGQRYAEGQEFKPHTDYFNPGGADYHTFCAQSGNRTWTFMIYLMTWPQGVLHGSRCSTRPSTPSQENCCAGTTACPAAMSTWQRSITG